MVYEKNATLVFKNEDKKNFSLNVKDLKEDVKEEDIQDLMDFIIEKKIMKCDGLDLVSKVSAKIIETSTETILYN